jgi:hypothetical protein
MSLINRLDLEKATFGDLYRFVDHARAAGIPEDQHVTVETTDTIGNPADHHVLVADLGDVEQLTRPVLIDRDAARDYFEALMNVLAQRDDKTDREVLDRLANDLVEIPQ